MNRGEVWWCQLPEPDNRRPVLILTRAPAVQFLDRLTVAPITSRLRPTPSFVTLTLDDGVFADSAVNCDSLMTTAKAYMGEFITRLSAERMAEVEAAIRFALALNSRSPT